MNAPTLEVLMNPIRGNELRQLIETDFETCVSIYSPTHRAGADTLQDPIRFKNLIREAETQLEKSGNQPQEIRNLLEPLRKLVDEYEFWQHQADGLAVFRSHELCRHYRLPFPVPELAVATQGFHLKPLLPALEKDQRFYVLALSQKSARLLVGDSERIVEIEIPDMPANPRRSPAGPEPQRKLQSHTGPAGRRFAIVHGHGAGEDDRKRSLPLYFHRVSEVVRGKFAAEPAPVVLAAVDYLCPIYRHASFSPDLLPAEIHGSPDSFTSEELHRLAWDIVSSHFRQARDKASDEYHQLWHTPRASNDLPTIVNAARQGRVKALFVAVGVQKWGRVDSAGGEIVESQQRCSRDQDLLNIAAMETFIAGGTVYAVPPEEVPSRSCVAAVFRY